MLTPVHILMVEDNNDFVYLVRESFEGDKDQWQIEVAQSLSEATQKLEKEMYDLILLDLSLPDSKGFDTFSGIKKTAPKTAIVVLTGLNDENIALQTLKEGAQDYIIKGNLNNQALKRTALFAIERQSIVEKWEKAWEEKKTLAMHDPLTGLPNRLLLKDRLHQSLSLAKRQGQIVAALFIDLDRFKEINDTMGHEVGDQFLKEVAQRLQTSVRQEDTIARLGGDEFIVLLYGPKTQTDIQHVATRILGKIEEPYRLYDRRYRLTASIGIALFPDSAQDSKELLRNADFAMYLAKNEGGNRYTFFSESETDFSLSHPHLKLLQKTHV
ncbi:MAG: GGDEF domain-containing response regulator [Deltaproteobacteria bacterium]|nr:GGDEF domain-containing response regulator [Deltaproteobacteria bacterium]